MSFTTWLRENVVSDTHHEPVGRLDRINGVGYSEDDGTEAEAVARCEKPRGAK